MKPCLSILLAFLVTASACPAQTATVAPPPAAQTQTFYYLTLTPAQELALIPPAPAPGSAEDKADLATILAAQASRTPAQVAEALSFQNLKLTLITSVIGPDFTAAKDPLTFAWLHHCSDDVFSVGNFLKNHYARDRPYVADPQQVHNLFPVPGYSYPSEHAEDSTCIADVLSLLYPSDATALQARAAAIAQSRVIAGVHYPSDIQEGAVLGGKLAALFQANPAFQQGLAAARAELHLPPNTPTQP